MEIKWTLVAGEIEKKIRTKNSASAFIHTSSGLEFLKVSDGETNSAAEKKNWNRNRKNCEM